MLMGDLHEASLNTLCLLNMYCTCVRAEVDSPKHLFEHFQRFRSRDFIGNTKASGCINLGEQFL